MKNAAVFAVLAAVLVAHVPGLAEPPKLGEGKGQVVLSWDEFVKITGYDPAKKGQQMLTIPWAEVEKLLGPEVKVEQFGKAVSVDLPWSEFKALLEWSVRRKEPKAVAPPTDYIATACQYDGTLTDEGAAFKLTAELNVLKKEGWKRIPLLPVSVALTKAALPDGVFINPTGATYELLTDRAGVMKVVLEFSVAVAKSAGINSVSFDRVLPGSTVLDLTIQQEAVDVKVAGAQSITTTAAVKVVPHDAPQELAKMEQTFTDRADAQARAAGGTPIRVRLPIDGKLYRLEKILALPQDSVWFEVQYSGWEAP